MNVLIVNTLYYPFNKGGAEKSVRLLAEELVLQGFNVYVLTLNDKQEVETYTHNGVVIKSIPIPNIYWPDTHKKSVLKRIAWHILDIYNVKIFSILNSVFKGIEFDIVHTNNLSGFSVSVWSWAHKRGYPITHTARDYYLFHPNCTMYSNGENLSPHTLKNKLLSAIKKYNSQKVSHFVGISNFIRKFHIENGFFRNATDTTIYNSIELGSVNKNVKKLDGNKYVFGYIGRLDKEKGIEFLLDSIKESGNKIRLLIAGAGDEGYVELLKNKSDTMDVHFLGKVAPAHFFESVDFTIVPSLWYEPMGRVVIESFSYGVPVIGSELGGIGELIDIDITGFKFEAGNKESLITALNNVNKINYKEMSNNCIYQSTLYTTKKMTNKYIEVFNSKG